MMVRELKNQAQIQLRQTAKVAGTVLLARLYEADRELDEIVRSSVRDSVVSASLEEDRKTLQAVGIASAGKTRMLFGPQIRLAASLDRAQERHLGEGRTLLVAESGARSASVLLVRNLGAAGSSTLIVAAVSPAHLWSDDGDPLVPGETEMCVDLSTSASPLHCAGDARRRGSQPDVEVITGTSELFLGFDFAAPSWVLRLTRPLDAFNAPVEFRRTVLLTLALGVWLVVFASNVLLRHRLDPVEKLQEATRRVAAGDFSARVTLSTRDELQDLGEAFNGMAERLHEQVQRLNAMSWGTLQALARSIDAVSPWTAGHSERVTRVAMAIGQQMQLPAEAIDQLHRGGLLHDVGKIGVSPAILDKRGKLDDVEYAAIREHPVIGARILEPIEAYEDVIPIVRHHHERFDGTGYPDRLAGRAIPFLARVLAVADVYDALVSHRPYREGWAPEAAVEYIASRAGSEFDPEVVAAFTALVASSAWAETTGAAGADLGHPSEGVPS